MNNMLAAWLLVMSFFTPVLSSSGQVAGQRRKGVDAADIRLAAVEGVQLKKVEPGEVEVTVGGQLLTRFVTDKYAKPIFFPIHNPAGVGMTRSWPMLDEKVGIADDHPHHKSMWFAHEINNVDFWTEKEGAIRPVKVQILPPRSDAAGPSLFCQSDWVARNGPKICSSQSIYQFGAVNVFAHKLRQDQPTATANWIDATYVLSASEASVTIQDTKEGTFAIRTHTDLRLKPDPKRGVEHVDGKAINSNGLSGKSIWGKTAKWVLYFGRIDGKPTSILMCDHPTNFRHPTTWHARDYGLVTANPFGLHDFQGLPKQSGQIVLLADQSLTLRYRVFFGDKILDAKMAEALYNEFADSVHPSITPKVP